MPVPYLACMIHTATFYRLPPRVLPAIHAVEGGAVGSVSRDNDGSADLGVMQINTRWVQPLAQRTGLAPGVVTQRLIHDACFNIAASGLIMRTYLAETGGNLMAAIGDYHSHTVGLNIAYRMQVLRAASIMFSARPRR